VYVFCHIMFIIREQREKTRQITVVVGVVVEVVLILQVLVHCGVERTLVGAERPVVGEAQHMSWLKTSFVLFE
jgi:hypothetical protein